MSSHNSRPELERSHRGTGIQSKTVSAGTAVTQNTCLESRTGIIKIVDSCSDSSLHSELGFESESGCSDTAETQFSCLESEESSPKGKGKNSKGKFPTKRKISQSLSLGDNGCEIFPFVCGLCDCKYKRFLLYYKHLKSHTTIRPSELCLCTEFEGDDDCRGVQGYSQEDMDMYQCGICESRFVTICQLHAHILTEEKLDIYVYENALKSARKYDLTNTEKVSPKKTCQNDSIADYAGMDCIKYEEIKIELCNIDSINAAMNTNSADFSGHEVTKQEHIDLPHISEVDYPSDESDRPLDVEDPDYEPMCFTKNKKRNSSEPKSLEDEISNRAARKKRTRNKSPSNKKGNKKTRSSKTSTKTQGKKSTKSADIDGDMKAGVDLNKQRKAVKKSRLKCDKNDTESHNVNIDHMVGTVNVLNVKVEETGVDYPSIVTDDDVQYTKLDQDDSTAMTKMEEDSGENEGHDMDATCKKTADKKVSRQMRIDEFGNPISAPHIQIPCHVCGKMYKRKNMRTHLLSHITTKDVICDICNKGFKSNNHLATHRVTHTIERNFICGFCGKDFHTRANMHQHEKTHLERNLQCPLCPSKFRVPVVLKRHIRTHSETNPYTCDVCHQSFKSPDYLRRHKFSHTDARPYACPTCNKTFKANHDLRKHKRIHQPFNIFCSFCAKGFVNRTNMRTHERIHFKDGRKPGKIVSAQPPVNQQQTNLETYGQKPEKS